MAQNADGENGPAARSFAADAHDCIMVRIQTDLPHTSVRREDAPQWRAPLGSSRRQAPSDAGVRREKPISLFILPPRAQASRRCETTSDAKAASRQAPLAFRSLDPLRALRELDRRRRDEERPFPLRTKNRLTGKAPYKSCANPICRAAREADRHAVGSVIRQHRVESARQAPTKTRVI